MHPAMARRNLEVRTRAHATGLVFEGKRAVGVQYRKGGRNGAATEVRARREVILSGGTFNSVQLLQLSGVGNAAELGALGVRVVADVPGVGEHLQDHLEVYIQYASKLPVSIAPGRTIATWMPEPSRSLHRPALNASIAAFDAA